MHEGGILDIGVDDYMKRSSGDIISRACFGSSYSKGQEIFLKLDALQEVISKKTLSVGIPGLSAKSSHFTSNAIDQFVVNNCKNIYLAGFETSAVSASWCLMLLASNPEWQTRVRDEVKEVFQGKIPNMDMLRKMKQV
ncbi:hypothetical protein BUALT_Bualt10G0095500 [Buddleja alternifolia]|uniref:Cytochrome P450 n=1 Tax=Buddleja alternifolia TaxID=168488 RepID=A0AAV6X5K9_9LAMI|nr:hypothetical protein BUALT_Bualt10G0095500 [Buddleja alternifolia]